MATVTGNRDSALAVLQDDLIGFEAVQIGTLEDAICVSGFKPAALACLLTLAEQGGLQVSTEMERRERLVQGQLPDKRAPGPGVPLNSSKRHQAA